MSKKDYINNIEGAERRFFTSEIRSSKESRMVEGYAAVFNKESRNLGGFVEVIERGAFDDVIHDDLAVALFNHDDNMILARNNRTMTLSVDETGLKYEFEAPNTTAGNDLIENLRLGNVLKSSFAFNAQNGDKWEKRDGLPSLRTIQKVSTLFDISPVVYEAYPDTSVAKRSLSQIDKYESDIDLSNREMKHTINKIKNKIKIG